MSASRRVTLLAAAVALAAGSPRAALAESSVLERGVGAIAIVNASVVPMTDSRVLAGWTVLIRGGRIEDMGPTRSYKVPRGAAVMDGSGLWLAPGLFDCAAAAGAGDLPRFLAAGVTTVRTVSGHGPSLLLLRDSIESGTELGPRLLVTGPALAGTDGEGGGAALTPLGARHEVEAQKRAGYDALAVSPGIMPLAYATATRAAQEFRLPVAGALPARVPRAEVLASGQRSKEGLVSELDPASGEPLLAPAALDAAAKADASSGIWTIPTLAVHRMRASAETAEALLARPEMKSVTPRVRAEWTATLAHRPAEPAYSSSGAVTIVRRLRAAGGRILLGSGAGAPFVVPGPSIHDEIAALLEAGLSPYEALRAGTRDAADALGELETSGTLEPGKRADVLVLRANPLEQPRTLADPAGLFLGGRWLPASKLRAAVDSVAGSFDAAEKRFASFEPLAVSEGYRYARYELTLAGLVVAEERVRVGPAVEGGRELRAQAVADPEQGALSELRVVTGEDGRARNLRVTRTTGGARDRVEVSRMEAGERGVTTLWGPGRLHASGEQAASGAFALDAECADGTVLAGPALAPGLDLTPVASAQLVLDRVDALPTGASAVIPVVRVALDGALSGASGLLRDGTCRVTRLDNATIRTADGPGVGKRFRIEQPGADGTGRIELEATLGPDGLVHALVGDAGLWSVARVR